MPPAKDGLPHRSDVYWRAPENDANHRAPAGTTWILGVDVGVRNLALALLAWFDGAIYLVALVHYDAGASVTAETNAGLYRQVLPIFEDLLEAVRAGGGRRAHLAIEQQQKQTNDAYMVEVAGLLEAMFCEAHTALLGTPDPSAIHKVQPSAQTSVAMQRRLLPGSRPVPVTGRVEKKARAVAMLKIWLEDHGHADVSAAYDAMLTRVGRSGKPVKNADRRDHVADAFLCAVSLGHAMGLDRPPA